MTADNLRYNFDYCVFGFPNATDIVGSSPCQTSTACGGLQVAMEDGNLKPNNFTTFGYCDANGGAATPQTYAKCLACISAGGDTTYIANGLSPSLFVFGVPQTDRSKALLPSRPDAYKDRRRESLSG